MLVHYFNSHSPNITLSGKIEVIVRVYSCFWMKNLSGLEEFFHPTLYRTQWHACRFGQEELQRLTGRVAWIEFIPLSFISAKVPPSPTQSIRQMIFSEELSYYRASVMGMATNRGRFKDSQTWYRLLRNVRRTEFESYISDFQS